MAEKNPFIHLKPFFPDDSLQSQEQCVATRRVFELMNEHLETCRQDPGYSFMLPNVEYLKPYLAVNSEQRQLARELVQAGRAKPPALYSEPVMCVQEESLIRNFLYAGAYCEKMLGDKAKISSITRPLSCHSPSPASPTELDVANRLAEKRLLSAEKWAAFASLLGAPYPDTTLDQAWRALLSAQGRAPSDDDKTNLLRFDLLASYREALELAVEVEDQSLAVIAALIDTKQGKRASPAGSALIVFNSLGEKRTDICRARVMLEGPIASGFKLLDSNRREVPYQVLSRSDEEQKPRVEIVFLAKDMPAIGFQTYYLKPSRDFNSGRIHFSDQNEDVNEPLHALQAPEQDGMLPSEFGLVSVDAPNLIITAVKRVYNQSTSKRGILLRLTERDGLAVKTNLTFSLESPKAWITDLFEQRIGELEITRPRWRRPAHIALDVPVSGTVTVEVELAQSKWQESLDRARDKQAPIALQNIIPRYCAYWNHNGGAAPMGDQPVTLWMRGPIPLGKNTRFPLGISNDSADREITGKIDLIAPSHWQLIPRQLPYRVGPGSQSVYEAMVIVPADAEPCFLRALTHDGEEMLQEVIPVGEIQPLALSLKRVEDGFVVELANPNPDYVEGEVVLITPLKSWGRAVGELAVCDIQPLTYKFRLEANQEEKFHFLVSGIYTASAVKLPKHTNLWAAAKVMWYGRVQYAFVDEV